MSAVNWIVGFVCLLYPARSLGQGTSSSPEHGLNIHEGGDCMTLDATSTGGHLEQVEESIACGPIQALNNSNVS